MNDRQKCEVSFVSRCVHMITIAGLKYSEHKDAIFISDLAYESAIEPFDLCDEKNKKSLIRRVMRMQEETINKMLGNSHGEKVVLTVYCFVEKLIALDYLVIPEESKLRIVIDYLLSILDVSSESVQKRFKSGRKQADKWLESLQLQGYYRI